MYGSVKVVLAVEGGGPSSLFLTSIDTLKYIPYTKLVNFHNKNITFCWSFVFQLDYRT